jgi:hypothetical protein
MEWAVRERAARGKCGRTLTIASAILRVRSRGPGGGSRPDVGRGVAVRRFSLLFVIYIIVGIIVAFSKNQITAPFLKDLVEALLYVLLWPLSLLGLVNLNL